MLFGPNIRPERQKLRLIQLISQDTPSTPCADGQRFCVLLLATPGCTEQQQAQLEQQMDLPWRSWTSLEFPSIIAASWWYWCSHRMDRSPFGCCWPKSPHPTPMLSPRRSPAKV